VAALMIESALLGPGFIPLGPTCACRQMCTQMCFLGLGMLPADSKIGVGTVISDPEARVMSAIRAGSKGHCPPLVFPLTQHTLTHSADTHKCTHSQQPSLTFLCQKRNRPPGSVGCTWSSRRCPCTSTRALGGTCMFSHARKV
jgi:hypothetical protein